MEGVVVDLDVCEISVEGVVVYKIDSYLLAQWSNRLTVAYHLVLLLYGKRCDYFESHYRPNQK